MCSMALVHSRIARVVYARPQPVSDTALRAPLGTVLTRACKHALHSCTQNSRGADWALRPVCSRFRA